MPGCQNENLLFNITVQMSSEAPLHVHTTQKNTQDSCKVTHVKLLPCPVLGQFLLVRLFWEGMAFTLQENILPGTKLSCDLTTLWHSG